MKLKGSTVDLDNEQAPNCICPAADTVQTGTYMSDFASICPKPDGVWSKSEGCFRYVTPQYFQGCQQEGIDFNYPN